MELISSAIYDLKVCHEIFIKLVEKENLSSQLQRQFLCMRFANNFTIYTCYSWMQWLSPIHHRPEQRDDTQADAVALGASERNGFKVTHTSSAVCTE